jgi:membrane-associated protease RseP (regulator of RpoE activity)
MRNTWYINVAALVWILGAPNLLAQDFLKQLEQRLFQKQQESKSKDPKPDEKPVDKPIEPIRFPSVLEPSSAPEPEELPPKSAPMPAGESSELPAPIKRSGTTESDVPSLSSKNSNQTSKGDEATKSNRSLLSPFPIRPKSAQSQSSPTTALPSGGFLGLTVEPLPGTGFGLTVVEVVPDSPAWKAGFRNGDRVIGVAGQAVSTVDAFAEQLAKFSPGSPVKFLVDRRGRQASLVAVLQDRSIAGQIQGMIPGTTIELAPDGTPMPASASRTGRAFFGVNVSDMSDGFRKQFAIPAYRGASVTGVIPNSPAEAAGLRPGDCIVDIDGRPVQAADIVQDSILRGRPGQVVTVSYYRGKQLTTASVALALDQEPPAQTYSPLQPSSPEMVSPEYVASLQSELERVNNELAQAQARMQQLEARLQALEKKR